MTNLSWRKLKTVRIDARPAGLWNLALEYVPASRLLRIKVADEDESGAAVARTWNPTSGLSCGPDGTTPQVARTLLWTQAPYGALIAKVGGSTADLPGKDGSFDGKKVFAVGSYAVIALDKDAGPLFLTMNDTVDEFYQHEGALWVHLEECPI
jgi:hypothetical protein